ncbi:MAG: hypothetical protein PVF77_11625 [Anaerolineae bacterium]|jgi:hypothetical protein
MVTVSEFKPDDQKVLDAMLAVSSGRADSGLTLEGLVARWNSFVAELDRGRRFSHQDYDRALADRAILDELDECLSAHGRQILVAAVLESDRRFLALTAPVNGQLRRPWWQRVPQD